MAFVSPIVQKMSHKQRLSGLRTMLYNHRLLAFLLVYVVFLLPVLIALIRDFQGLGWHVSQEPMLTIPLLHQGGFTFLMRLSEWLLLLFVIYLLFRWVGKKLGIKQHDKSPSKHRDDLLRLFYFGFMC